MANADIRVFDADAFANRREWLLFCLEFELELCHACHLRACKSPGREIWYCATCRPPLHPSLIEALHGHADPTARCRTCHRSIPLPEGYLSADARDFYCRAHVPAEPTPVHPPPSRRSPRWEPTSASGRSKGRCLRVRQHPRRSAR